jgi:hypothetical protein
MYVFIYVLNLKLAGRSAPLFSPLPFCASLLYCTPRTFFCLLIKILCYSTVRPLLWFLTLKVLRGFTRQLFVLHFPSRLNQKLLPVDPPASKYLVSFTQDSIRLMGLYSTHSTRVFSLLRTSCKICIMD